MQPNTSFAEWIDRVGGIAALSTPNRRRVRGAQINSVIRMAPLGTIGIVLALILFNIIVWETPAYTMMLVFSALLVSVQLSALGVYFTNKKTGRAMEASLGTLGKIGISGGLFGALWGAIGYLAILSATKENLFIVGLLISGTLFTTLYCFRTVFMGSISFIFTSGIIITSAFYMRGELVTWHTSLLLLASYFLVVAGISFTQMKDFVKNAVAEVKSSEAAKFSDALLQQFEETSNEWFWALDHKGRPEKLSDELKRVLEATGLNLLGINHKSPSTETDPKDVVVLNEHLKSSDEFNDVRVSVDMAGQTHWMSFSGRRIIDKQGVFTGYIGVCSDVTRERQNEQKLQEMASKDGLTGLVNRTSFYDLLDSMVRRLERFGTSFTLIFLDLDKFKLVNDTYGHHTGDALLVEVGVRIKKIIRDNDVLGRLGGDEFAIAIERGNDPILVAKLCSRIIQQVSEPYFLEGETLYIGVSIGVAMAPVHGTQREQLLRNADLALYRAKEEGRGVFRYFEAQMDFQQRERRILEQEMRQALTDSQFEMKFQPLISTKTGAVVCMEALIRWNHDVRGSLSPEEFIPIAEQSNLIIDVGRWSLKSACQTAVTWPDNVGVAVNISALHFMRADIVRDVFNVLEETGLDPSRLEIELTESLLVEDSDETITKLNGLRKLGVSIAMDDFGTGYSSLGYLTRFRFDRIKIDKSFLINMQKNDQYKPIIHTISTLGENLGINITVEGVETLEHVEFIKTITCDKAQGFYYSPPLVSADVSAFLLKTFSETIADKHLPKTAIANRLTNQIEHLPLRKLG